MRSNNAPDRGMTGRIHRWLITPSGGTTISTQQLCHSEKSKSRRRYGAVLGVSFGVCRGRSSGATFRSFSTMQGFMFKRRQRPLRKYWQCMERTLPSRSTTVYSTGSDRGERLFGTEHRERIVCVGSVRLQRYHANANPVPKPETAPPRKFTLRIEASMLTIIAQRGGTR